MAITTRAGKLRAALKEDEMYGKYKRIVKNARALDLDSLLKEVETTHASRAMRGLKSNKVSAKRVILCGAEDQAYRSRLVELNMKVSSERHMLSTAYQAMKDYLNANYAHTLQVRTQADKEASWRTLLSSGKQRIEDLEHTSKMIEMVISDIDKAGYLIRNLVDALDVAINKGYAA